MTIKSGGSLLCDGTDPGFIMGVGADNVGKLIIEGGGSFSMTGGYALFCGRSYGDPAGTGMIIIEPGGSFSCTEAMLYLGLYDEVFSDTQHGVFQVIGGGSYINAPQFRAHRRAEIIVCPTGNGAEGLSTIQCEYLIHRSTDAMADTENTLTVAPRYQVTVGDAWTAFHFEHQRFNDFQTIQTVPADLGVTCETVGNDVVITVTHVPAPASAPTDLTATLVSDRTIQLDWSAAGEQYGFLVERSADGGAYTEVATVDGETLTYTNSGLAYDTEYTYQVTALGVGGIATTTRVTVTTPVQPQMPAAGIGALLALSGALAAFSVAKAKKH